MSTSAQEYLASDSALHSDKAFKALFDKYSKVASDDVITKTKEALEKKNHKVTVVADKAEALKTVIDLIPEGASIHNPSSTTLVRASTPPLSPTLLSSITY